MRWGEPNRLPPVRRGRGLAAAALLAVGLVAAYAILAVLSLTSVAPSILDGIPHSVSDFGGGGSVHAVTPKVTDFVRTPPTPTVPDLSALRVDLTSFSGSSDPLTETFDLQNTAVTPVRISLAVTGVVGVNATFPDHNSTRLLAADKTTTVTVTSDPMHAGPLNGNVVISVSGVAQPFTVPLSGVQAPLPPGAVTATPESGGAVHVTWPASPSTGVAGYEVDRRVAGGQWEPLPGSAPAAGIVDQTGTDGQTVDYRVSAITAGVSRQLLSSAGGTGSAVTDASAPDLPTKVQVIPNFVNLSNEDSVPVEVDLPPTSSPTDVVSVTLTDGTDGPVTATTAGGQPSVVVNVDAHGFADGTLTASATLTDAVGNATAPTEGVDVVKDTQAPDPPADANPPEVVNGDQAESVPVVVHVPDAETGERVHVQITGDGQTADGGNDVSGFATTVNVDASKLPDGQLTVSAWTIDAAGNPSNPIDGGSFKKDANAPEGALNIHIAGGEANPAGYVNAASAHTATVVVHFADPTNPADNVVVNVAGNRFFRDGGADIYVIGPVDLSGEPDGRLFLAATVTDPAGNSTTATDYAVKDTIAPSAPTSFTVPETGDNAAGVVNSLTQNAAIIQATFPEGTDSSDALSASVNGIDLGSRVGGSIAVQWRADVSSLPDGQLDLHGTITDAAGNTTDFSGRAVKETQAPPPPVAAHVIGFCRPDTIVPATANDVSVQVVLPDMPGLSGTVTVTLTDSAGHTASGTASGGPGIVVVHGIDAGSFVPGNVQLSVSITDSAGNTSTFAGTPAVYVDNTDE
jgi:hypothetical protein